MLFRGPVRGASLPAALRSAVDYLEGGMGYRTPGLLWSHFVDCAPRRRDGGCERCVRFPRPLRVGADGQLPAGDYDGAMTLALSDAGCRPAFAGGGLEPSIEGRGGECEATLQVERLTPLRAPPPPPPPPLAAGKAAEFDPLLY